MLSLLLQIGDGVLPVSHHGEGGLQDRLEGPVSGGMEWSEGSCGTGPGSGCGTDWTSL